MNRARVTADGRPPADLRGPRSLDRGGETLVENLGDAAKLRTLDQAIADAQTISRRLTEGRSGASVDDFLRDRGPRL
jgi:hypothetical protein